MLKMHPLIILPARMGTQRLLGKPLADIQFFSLVLYFIMAFMDCSAFVFFSLNSSILFWD